MTTNWPSLDRTRVVLLSIHSLSHICSCYLPYIQIYSLDWFLYCKKATVCLLYFIEIVLNLRNNLNFTLVLENRTIIVSLYSLRILCNQRRVYTYTAQRYHTHCRARHSTPHEFVSKCEFESSCLDDRHHT